MDAFVINGGRPLHGAVRVNGSKNATLPLLAAALLTDETLTLRDVPDLADIANMLRLLERLGCSVERDTDQRSVALRVHDHQPSTAPYDIVRTMRASICVLGPLLAKRGEVRIAMPGGCAIGDRPIDLHLRGLEALGAELSLDSGDVVARAPGGRLKGTTLFLGGPFGPTVLGTANVMAAATLAEGRTVIECAACEPEVADLARMLNNMGAKIAGAGTPRITVDGVQQLAGADHTVIPDRIEAGTYLIAAAITNSPIRLTNFPHDALLAALDHLGRVGVRVSPVEGDDQDQPMRRAVEVASDRLLRPTRITTQPHPGFPTDLQAQSMALLCLASGNSVITERIYEQRFLHVAELTRMGAQLHRQGPTVVVTGVDELVGAPVMASDLRASASLVLAALAARGTTSIRRVYHLDRGYERMDQQLKALGADIQRVDDSTLDDGQA